MQSIDYESVKQRRRMNAQVYEERFRKINRISVEPESIPYIYPLNIGKNIKKELIENKILCQLYGINAAMKNIKKHGSMI